VATRISRAIESRASRGARCRGENDFQKFREELAAEHYRHQQAAQRIITSYSIKDPEQRIALIKSALERDHSVFNGYNSLDYAYLGWAINSKPQMPSRVPFSITRKTKAGYCDLAAAYLALDDHALCKEYLQKAIEVAPSARDDIHHDERFRDITI
jgi:tetratricopeptide (TPR) repeat protein